MCASCLGRPSRPEATRNSGAGHSRDNAAEVSTGGILERQAHRLLSHWRGDQGIEAHDVLVVPDQLQAVRLPYEGSARVGCGHGIVVEFLHVSDAQLLEGREHLCFQHPEGPHVADLKHSSICCSTRQWDSQLEFQQPDTGQTAKHKQQRV